MAVNPEEREEYVQAAAEGLRRAVGMVLGENADPTSQHEMDRLWRQLREACLVDSIDAAWDAVDLAISRSKYRGSSFAVAADGPGYRAWVGIPGEIKLEAWSHDMEDCDGFSEHPSPAQSLRRLLAEIEA